MKLISGDIGIISDVDEENMLVRVKWMPSEVVSPWLMFITPGYYYMPEANEQVVCFYDERRRQGVAFGRAWKEGEPMFADKNIIGVKLGDTEIFLERDSGKVTVITSDEVNVKASKIRLEADTVEVSKDLTVGGKSEFTGDMTAKAKIDATGTITSMDDVKAKVISLSLHKHPTAATGPPSPPIP